MRLGALIDVLLTRISSHTGLLFGAYINDIGQSPGLAFFSSATKETVFSHAVSLPHAASLAGSFVVAEFVEGGSCNLV